MTKASARLLLRVELHGVDLPGRSCGPRPGGGWYQDIQVGLKKGTTAIDLVPGDAAEATWSMDVTVREIESGAISLVDRGRLISSGRDSGTFASAQRRLRSTE